MEAPMSLLASLPIVLFSSLFVAQGGPASPPPPITPRVLSDVKPGYTPAALRAKLVGALTVQIEIALDGSVQSARVVRSCLAVFGTLTANVANPCLSEEELARVQASGQPDPTLGLSENAVSAVRRWRFEPLAGQTGPVATTVDLEFMIR
jgi:outer membrane biosynthesis protein TonB